MQDVNDSSRGKRPGSQQRAAGRRRSSDWYSAKFRSLDEMADADVEEAASMAPEERLRLVFLLSGQLVEAGLRPRGEWPVGVMRFGTEPE